jgi:hypothetical protein
MAAGRQRSKLVAVVVPIHNRKELTADEQISLRHLVHFLGKYDKYMVAPESLDVEFPGFAMARFSDKFFGSISAHTRLMLSRRFYSTFSDYKYILIYHLDALVFSDQIMDWCNTDLDYVGPPWINCADSPWVKRPRVGNGGFSLRKIESFLKVFDSSAYAIDPFAYWQNTYATGTCWIRCKNLPKKYLKRLRCFNGVKWDLYRWPKKRGVNEDHFWSGRAVRYYPDFRIADLQTGLRFAFEVAPKLCFELNEHKLPFGCHAWPKYDRAFWEPYLLKD